VGLEACGGACTLGPRLTRGSRHGFFARALSQGVAAGIPITSCFELVLFRAIPRALSETAGPNADDVSAIQPVCSRLEHGYGTFRVGGAVFVRSRYRGAARMRVKVCTCASAGTRCWIICHTTMAHRETTVPRDLPCGRRLIGARNRAKPVDPCLWLSPRVAKRR